jgi:hypothetical protein
MLVLHQLLYVLSTLCGLFMHFMELTYWQDATVPVPCFLLFLVPEKLKNKYSRNWKRKRPKVIIHRKTPEARRRAGGGATGWPHPYQVHPPWPRLGVVWAPWWATGSALSPIYSHDGKNPSYLGQFSRKVPQPPPSRRQVLGDRSLCSDTLPGRGSAPGEISIDSTAISIAVADSHDEEWVVLPRGWGLY